ncbi:MAG: phosphoenolpyruvate carboxylase [Candidatus Vogelbacteria bacterium CG10_big_fil_rev_8_21_14_0_10_51_16]|uniref:Phosphoenolpyruvate carboxylase n=1 Tax=Candidatus Vogelbacteria bacterium CG10_big_fil_rev_8_21_14_0_10_51_16 TaxID=1975045 RepID=A0A2H0RGQ6_9BACT|nr:MAG: phosphoenolpyruvate carboxylase [Candidatus Vogelbacteria bacterium CG10_big_fil_rev_8_21_14_0_10_51_16]
MTKIPKTMATQHPDNVRAPYWKKNGDGFISSSEETTECMDAFRNLGIEEFMWDWEGKFADEAVVDRLFHHHFDYFKKNPLGLKRRLTFRIPNTWQEKGYSLIRSLMVVLTSEDFARDLKFYAPPIFEIILPMTENAEQLIFIQKTFRELSRLKSRTFSKFHKNTEYVRIIPLFEGVDTQINAKKILKKYLELHQKTFKFTPSSLRVFIARSDPALLSGLIPTVLANKIILSDLREMEKGYGIKFFPIIGAGSLPFRGGLSPLNMKKFLLEYPGISTITLQPAFRYDYPLPKVRQAIKYYNKRPTQKSQVVSSVDRKELLILIAVFEKEYQSRLSKVVPDLRHIFESFPCRRERHPHIGLFSYDRKINKVRLPRATTFTGSFYSLGIPPEFLGIGAFTNIKLNDFTLINKYYKNHIRDIVHAGKFLNWGNLKKLGEKNIAWQDIDHDIKRFESIFSIKCGPRRTKSEPYVKLTNLLLAAKDSHIKVQKLIVQSGILRKSLG